MNWKQMKEFCAPLNEEQLKKKVILWREDEAISKIEPMTLEEDHYIDPEIGAGEGCFPASEATEPIEDLKKVYDKGDPILAELF